jgi:exodeoxyribonuclease III
VLDHPLSILSWNLRHGGGSRNMPRIVLDLLEHAADVIVLSEFRRTTGGQIAGALADHGWLHQHSTEPPAGVNGMLIASRLPLAVHTQEQPAVTCGRAARAAALRLAAVEIAGVMLIGAHIPCGGPGAERTAREHVFQCLLSAARRGREGACVVVGDLNAGRHRLDEEGATFTCVRLFGQLAALGYVDAWRRLNPEGREFSWRSARGGGFRLDHALVSQALAPRIAWCRYAHECRESGVSDHSALLLGLG